MRPRTMRGKERLPTLRSQKEAEKKRKELGEGPHGNRKYDWGTMFSSPSFHMRYGVEFNCGQSSAVQLIRNQAAKFGVKVRVRGEMPGSFTVEVLNPIPRKLEVRGGEQLCLFGPRPGEPGGTGRGNRRKRRKRAG